MFAICGQTEIFGPGAGSHESGLRGKGFWPACPTAVRATGLAEEYKTMVLNYLALGLMIFGALVCFYLIIAIHDIPYEIAKKRNHPHQDAIHVAGWVSLLTLHVIWPFLWIWATIYQPERGYGFSSDSGYLRAELSARLAAMETRLAALEGGRGSAPPAVEAQLLDEPPPAHG